MLKLKEIKKWREKAMIEYKRLRDGDIVKVGKQRYILVETNVDRYSQYALKCDYSMRIPRNVIASMIMPRTFIGFNVKDIRKWQYLNLYDNTVSFSLAKEQMTDEERNITILKIRMLHRDKIDKNLDYIVYDKKKTYEMRVHYNDSSRLFELSTLSVINSQYTLFNQYQLIITEKECYIPPNEKKDSKTVIDINKKSRTADTLRYLRGYGVINKEFIKEYANN